MTGGTARSLLLIFAAIFFCGIAYAQGPDICGSAAKLCPGTPLSTGNVGATPEGSLTGLCFGINNSVWFKFTTNSTGGAATISFTNVTGTASNLNDTIQAALIAEASPCSLTTLTTIACNNVINGSGVLNAGSLSPNTTYYIIVDGRWHDQTLPPGEATFSIAISGPAVDFNATFETTGAMCGKNNGSIKVNVTPGDSTNYTYSLDNGSYKDSRSFNNVGPGSHTVKVKDATGCIKSFTATLPNTGGPSQINIQVVPADCGVSNGSITLDVMGGAPPYVYTFNSSNPGNDSVFDNLMGGEYTIKVTDDNGCDTVLNIGVNNTSGIQFANVNTTESSCLSPTGTATVINIIPSNGNYSFSLNNGTAGSSPTFSGLAPGVDTIVVTDLDNPPCKYTFYYVYIGEEMGPSLLIEGTLPDCSAENGSLLVSSWSGVSPFVFEVNGISQTGSPGVTFEGLGKGLYSVVATDDHGCKDTTRYDLTERKGITDFNVSTTPVVCNSSFGKAVIDSVKGGNSADGYTYALNGTTQSSPEFSNLSAGTYSVTVADINGCSFSEEFTVAAGALECDASVKVSDDIEKFQLSTEAEGDIKWTNKIGNVIATGHEAEINPNGGGQTVIMVVTTPEGCTCEKEVLLPLIIVPTNLFSPNDDGTNDTWRIRNIENFPDCDVYIYSRWGQRVFHSKGYPRDAEWNGEYLGAKLPAGTYYYIIDLHNGMKAFKSFVTIVR